MVQVSHAACAILWAWEQALRATVGRQEQILKMLHSSLHCAIPTRPENHKALILEGLRHHISPFRHHPKTPPTGWRAQMGKVQSQHFVYKDLSCNIKCDCYKTCPDRVGGSFFIQTFLFFFFSFFGGRRREGGRGNKPWQISHIKLYDVVLTNMNISDVCVHTALPVKHFRSLVHQTCSDIGGLITNEHCNEYTHTCSSKPLWVGRYQKQNLKFPFGSLNACFELSPCIRSTDLPNE